MFTEFGSAPIRRIGFVATRVYGTDGVSLEIGKWASVLERLGADCFYICGKSDRPADRTYLIEKGNYHHPEIQAINNAVFSKTQRSKELSRQIRSIAEQIKEQLYEAIERFSLDLLVAENSLTIPLNIPLGAALLEVIMETGIAAIAHHHDFVWERERFLVNAVDDYIEAAFPPVLPQLEHVVINTLAGEEFARRTGLNYRYIPNVMDFAHPPPELDEFAADFRQAIGLTSDDILILQPTRVVARKGIEHTVELAKRLDEKRCVIVVTHSEDDEGSDYPRWLRQFADLLGVRIMFVNHLVADRRAMLPDGKKQYSVWDVYPHADLVAYPSRYEGFGNAFLEAVYYRKPIFCNRYSIYRTDIEPHGFEAVVMDGFVTDEVVDQVRRVLTDAEYRQSMVENNYSAGRRCFSFERLEEELRMILHRFSLQRELQQRQSH